eukprot:3675273-Rhodomonas_salina.2
MSTNWLVFDCMREACSSVITRYMYLQLNTDHTLNIFEPRYRAMYNDILFSGARRFAVCPVDEEGRFARVASVFYLKDLQEVSEQTGDQIKFICEHEVGSPTLVARDER